MGINHYSSPNEFRQLFEHHLRDRLTKELEDFKNNGEAVGQNDDHGLTLIKHIPAQKQETVERIIDFVGRNAHEIDTSFPKYPKELVDSEIEKELSRIKRSRFFGGFSVSEHSLRLSEKILNGDFSGGADAVKSRALAWCARFLSYGDNGAKSDELLQQARRFGNGSENTIAVAFRHSANDRFGEALNLLNSIDSSVARSAGFMIATHHLDSAAAIEWLEKSGMTHTDLDADGKFILINKLLDLNHWDTALEYANALHEDDYQNTPALLHSAAMAHLVQAVPNELRSFVLHTIPFDARNFPLDSTATSYEFQQSAQKLFHRCSLAVQELDCMECANINDDYALWLALRDPHDSTAGKKRLAATKRDLAHALRRLPFVLQFGPKLNHEEYEAIEQEIERQTVITGGKSRDAAIARFALAFTQESPKSILAYLDRHRVQLHDRLEKKAISIVEIEMLAQTGLPRQAEECLEALIEDGLSEVEQNYLRRIIAESTGADPVEARKAQFEKSDHINDLGNLVSLLKEQNDWSQLCRYGALLFKRTRALADAECLARALNEEKRYGDLADLLRTYPGFLDQSDNLQMLWSRILYREGALEESNKAVQKLVAKREHQHDRALMANLAITSGAWWSLLPLLETEWHNKDKREANDLMQTAQLAVIVKSPHAKDLVYAAATKGSDDAGILVSAYFLAVRAGWEDEPAVGQWINNAAQLSDASGPLQKMTMKDLVDRAPEWNRHEIDIWQQVYQGTIPIFGAAHLLNKSLIDLFLLPALANPSEQDPRKRALIPAYSGVRQPLPCHASTVAVDATALLTLSALGLLKKVSHAFKQIFIPHSTLRWLFAEKQRVSFHQPSRIKNASKLRQVIAAKDLAEFNASTTTDADLAAEVGEELAAFITAANADDGGEDRQKIVIRSSPVHRINSFMQEEAELSPYYSCLCSCLGVVNKLQQKGQLTEVEAQYARSYLSLQEQQWPQEPEIADNAILYLDDLSVTYLQYTKLLEKLRPAGLEAYISTRVLEEVDALLRYQQLSNNVDEVIEDLRGFLSAGIQSKKIKLGQLPSDDDVENPTQRHYPTFAILDLAKDVDAIIVDDRFVNQHRIIDSGSDHTPILTTLDLIDALCAKDEITFEQMLEYRTMLRRACYLFVPITEEELAHHLSAAGVVESCLVETAELKAIRDNLLRVRMSLFLQLPKEAAWLNNTITTLINALKNQWRLEIDEGTSIARSNWLLELVDLRGWAHCAKNDDGLGISDDSFIVWIMPLLLVLPTMPLEVKERYWRWMDEHVLEKLSQEEPATYAQLVEHVKTLIAHEVEQYSLMDTE